MDYSKNRGAIFWKHWLFIKVVDLFEIIWAFFLQMSDPFLKAGLFLVVDPVLRVAYKFSKTDSCCLKMVNFYITRLEWSFHSMKRHKNSQKTTLWIVPHFSKIWNARNFQVYFGPLKCKFRQNFSKTFWKIPSNSISIPYQK